MLWRSISCSICRYVGTDSFAATGKPDNGADEASYATVPGGGVGEAGYMPVLPVNTVGESGVKPDTGVDESSYATVSATGTSDVLNAIGLNRNGYTDVAPVPESDDPDGFIWNEGGCVPFLRLMHTAKLHGLAA